jgi:hypothetical protein
MYIQIKETDWNEIGAAIEELYGMVHTLNDCLNDGRTGIAKEEAADIEKRLVKVLDLYNKIEHASN